MKFKLASYGRNTIILIPDDWDDFGYMTTFHVNYCDNDGLEQELGTIKIAKTNMDGNNGTGRTRDYLDAEFDNLPEGFFSLWQTAEAYKRVVEIDNQIHFDILKALNDIAYDPQIYEKYKDEKVLKNSLMRFVSLSLYRQQFRRIARGEEILISYDFSYVILNENPHIGNVDLHFSVEPDKLPPTNIHAIIGSNGVGKTTLIKNMIRSICKNENQNGGFIFDAVNNEKSHSFENTICISFNPFDDYSQVELCSKNYKYIGIKKEYEPVDEAAYEDGYGDLSLLNDIQSNFSDSLKHCLADLTKKADLIEILEMLETECGFISSNYKYDMSLEGVTEAFAHSISTIFSRLSAGHKVVLSIITRCIDVLVEKSVIFIDEPENHLHPPLLSSLIRGLSMMLMKRNGVAIISTHSPIVLQEIPKSCVWILNRNGNTISARRPEIETFGTNIGVLTNEIFGYEVKRTGFNTLLQNAVEKYNDYESVLQAFDHQLGDEAKSIVRIMLNQKAEL